MKKALILLAVLLAALLGVAACTENQPICPALIGGGSFCLQPTAALAPFEAQQKIEIRFRDRRETMIADIENGDSGLHFVGLTPFGQTLLQVSYDNLAAQAKTLPDRRINPALPIALLQIALWPTESVRAGLEAPLALEESSHQRRVIHRGEAIMSIDYTGETPPYRRIALSIPAADIELDIETLQPIGQEP